MKKRAAKSARDAGSEFASEARLSEENWESYLGEELSRRVRVVYGRSRSTPLQARRPRAELTAKGEPVDWLVRMHAMFAAAPPPVRSAVVDLLHSGRRARRSREVLERWIVDALARHPPPPVRESSLSTRGRHHDLARLAADLLARELREDFGRHRATPRLTWGRTSARGPRRGLRLGSYDAELALVRIHPALDQSAVLHAVHPPARNDAGRWIRHGAAFCERENAYPDLARALAWEKRHIDALIRSARTGKPLAQPRSKRGAVRRLVQRLLFPD